MNLNLNRGADPDDGLEVDTVQSEIDEHIEIMRRGIGEALTGVALLLADPEIPGVYRVWLERESKSEVHRRGQDPTWMWVTPDGEVIATQRPWSVTD